MEKLIIKKTLEANESKIDRYSKITDTLINKAKELKIDKVEVSSDFAPIIALGGIKMEPNITIEGPYLFGTKDDIKFIISPSYVSSGKIGDCDIDLVN